VRQGNGRGACFLALDSVHGVCGTCDRGACSGACFLALESVHGVRCMCNRAVCSGACLFALDSMHGVCVARAIGEWQGCVFFGT